MSQSSSRLTGSLASAKPGFDALSISSFLCAAGTLAAQTAAPAAKPGTQAKPEEVPMTMDEVVVEADAAIYNVQRLQSSKYTEPLRDIPQTITVIPKAVIEDRGAFSLRDVLRNTPGISMQAGEGGGGLPGDSLSIRGFSSRSDFYMDGMRDYGAYNRDPFNTEQVEVTKGPSSATQGRGSTGGSINLASKMANLENSNVTNVTYGSSNLYRGTVDVNQKLGEHSAFRLNGLYNHNDVPGRNNVVQERWGIAASLGLGLGTDTRFFLNYQHMTEDNVPDYGIPWIPNNGTFVGAAAGLNQQFDKPSQVDYSTWYGMRNVDYEDVRNDTITGILEHDFSDKLKVRNVTRYTRTYRDSVYTAPRFRDIDAAVGNQYNFTLNRQMQRREMTSEVFANQTILNAEFDTGPLKHAFVTGLELYWERQLNANAAGINTTTTLMDPSVSGSPTAPANNGDTTLRYPDLPGAAEAHLDTIAVFIFDTIKIGRHWEINGGIRYDYLQSDVRGAGGVAGISREDNLFSYKAGLVYKPAEHGSIYFGYGTSFNPSIDGASNTGLSLANGTNTSTAGLSPEQTNSYELGTKWDVFNERLSITAALFRSEKTNARTTDAAGITTLGGDQVVQGVELGLSGNLTKNWQVFTGYAYMQSETSASTATNEVGQQLSNAPEHTFNLWTTYTLFGKLQGGFGAQYVGMRTNGNTSAARTAPPYWTLDAMLSYKFTDKFSLRLNIYNLGDERYIDRISGGHFIPGPGRSVALTASVKF